jgi:hypothetical protein
MGGEMKKQLILIVWNGIQCPVIVKGLLNQKLQSRSEIPEGRLPCRVWKGYGDNIDKEGFAQESCIYKLEDDEARHNSEKGLEEAQVLALNDRSEDFSSYLARSNTDHPMSTHVGKSEATDSATVPTDPQRVLSSLPLRLHILLEEHYAEKGTEQPPICASQEDAEPVTTAMGESIVFLGHLGQDVTVNRFSTGFNSHIFLVAQGTSIIKYRDNGRIAREYAVGCGGDKFDAKSAFQAVVDATITLKSKISFGKNLMSSQEVSTDM